MFSKFAYVLEIQHLYNSIITEILQSETHILLKWFHIIKEHITYGKTEILMQTYLTWAELKKKITIENLFAILTKIFCVVKLILWNFSI